MSSLTVLCTGVTLLLVVGATLTHSQNYYRTDNLAWERFNISSVVFDHIEYHSRRVEIWEHTKNQEQTDAKRKRYYLTPLCELDPTTAATNWNNVTREFEVRFAVRMWDDPMIEAAWKHLKDTEEPMLPINRVQVLPIQTVALRCPRCKDIVINGDAMQVTSLPKQVYFNLHCDTTEGCGHLVTLMNSKPEQFQVLRFLFAFQGQQLHEDTIYIEFDAVLDGDLLSNVKELLPGKHSAYLLPEDARLLIRQSLQNIQSTYLEASVILESNYLKRLNGSLNNYLVQGVGDAAKFTPDKWDSVFWPTDAGIPRPDILTKRLTEIHSRLKDNPSHRPTQIPPPPGNESMKKALENLFTDVTPNRDNDPMSREAVEKEIRQTFGADDVKGFVTQACKFVRWSGSKFTIKPMSLKSIRLSKGADPKKKITIQESETPKNDGGFRLAVKFYPSMLIRDVSFQPENDLADQRVTQGRQTNVTREIEEIRAMVVQIQSDQSSQLQQIATLDRQLSRGIVTARALGSLQRTENETDLTGNTASSLGSFGVPGEALTNLLFLLAHFHSKTYVPSEPVWYSSHNQQANDAINSFKEYGLVSYLPPTEPLWIAYVKGSHFKEARLALHNFWNKSTTQYEVKIVHTDTPFVWDPLKGNLLYFNGKTLLKFPGKGSEVTTEAPWKDIAELSFDWTSKNMYILSTSNFLFVQSTERPYSWIQLKCFDIERIVVDPHGGYLFWIAQSSPFIRRSWLDCSNVTTIWDLNRPFNISSWCLTMDYKSGTLYVVDSSERLIVALDRNGEVMKTIQPRWADGTEASLFTGQKNLNVVPNGLVVMGDEYLYYLDSHTETVHKVRHAPLSPTTRYFVFSSDPSLYPNSTNLCSVSESLECFRYATTTTQSPDYDHYYRNDNDNENDSDNSPNRECLEYKIVQGCDKKVCLHNPLGQKTCH